MVKQVTIQEILNFFKSTEKHVVTFVGYSGAEYEDKAEMIIIANNILNEYNPASTMINIGATLQGIGAIYELAQRRGFTTSGIISTQAKLFNATISQFVDHVFYVEDPTWGGFIEGTDRLSPTSTVMVEVSDTMIGIGGGEIGRDELMAAKRSGKEVRFFPAEMNHQIARDTAMKKGLPEPLDFRGAAAKAFES